MTSDNVEVVQDALDAWVIRDYSRVLRSLDRDVELVPIKSVLEGGSYRGHDGFLRFLADMDEDWDDYRSEPDEIRAVDEDRVLVIGRFHGRGKASGMEVETPAAWLCELRDEKIVRLKFYADERAALEALRSTA